MESHTEITLNKHLEGKIHDWFVRLWKSLLVTSIFLKELKIYIYMLLEKNEYLEELLELKEKKN